MIHSIVHHAGHEQNLKSVVRTQETGEYVRQSGSTCRVLENDKPNP